MLRNIIKSGLRYFGLLERLQYSNSYRSLRSRAYRAEAQSQYAFYSTLLPEKCALIFDIGAHVGDHTHILLKFSRRVICVEPDPRNHKILELRFGRNKRVEILNKAVSGSAGLSTLYMEGEGSAFNTLSRKWVDILGDGEKSRFETKQFGNSRTVETLTLDMLVATYGVPDFVKIDVEGFEKEVISGLSTALPLIGLECNLPEFLEETIFIVERLAELDDECRFKYGRPEETLSREYLTGAEMVRALRTTDLRYMELYCRGPRSRRWNSD